MQACQAYQSCPVCLHAWTKGLFRKASYDGYRRFLPAGAEGREQKVNYCGQVYEYRNVCDEPKPKYRDGAFVKSVVALATPKKPLLGHKDVPMVAGWPGFDWRRYNIPEIMHGICLKFSTTETRLR